MRFVYLFMLVAFLIFFRIYLKVEFCMQNQ